MAITYSKRILHEIPLDNSCYFALPIPGCLFTGRGYHPAAQLRITDLPIDDRLSQPNASTFCNTNIRPDHPTCRNDN
jgi:hypothetical protein